jgi:hypothetical protein
VMADAVEYGRRIGVESAARSARDLQRVRNRQGTRNRRTFHPRFRRRFATPAQGREQPSGPASGRQSAPHRGVALYHGVALGDRSGAGSTRRAA